MRCLDVLGMVNQVAGNSQQGILDQEKPTGSIMLSVTISDNQFNSSAEVLVLPHASMMQLQTVKDEGSTAAPHPHSQTDVQLHIALLCIMCAHNPC